MLSILLKKFIVSNVKFAIIIEDGDNPKSLTNTLILEEIKFGGCQTVRL